MHIQLDGDGRIVCSSEDGASMPGSIEFDLPDGFDFARQRDYRIVDGGLLHDPEPPTDDEVEAARRAEFAETAPERIAALEASTDDVLLLVADMIGGAL